MAGLSEARISEWLLLQMHHRMKTSKSVSWTTTESFKR